VCTQEGNKAQSKAQQAVGGVHLARLSFPPPCNADALGGKRDKIVEYIGQLIQTCVFWCNIVVTHKIGQNVPEFIACQISYEYQYGVSGFDI